MADSFPKPRIQYTIDKTVQQPVYVVKRNDLPDRDYYPWEDCENEEPGSI